MANSVDAFKASDILDHEQFRLSSYFALATLGLTLTLFGFTGWQAALQESARIDAYLVADVQQAVHGSQNDLQLTLDVGLPQNAHGVNFIGLFTADGKHVAGNLSHMPADVPADDRAHATTLAAASQDWLPLNTLRAAAGVLPDGRKLVVARSTMEVDQLGHIMLRALLLGVLPATALSMLVGVLLSMRSLSRLRAMDRTLVQVMGGDLQRRLEVRGGRDSLDRLAQSVNQALDEIGRLVGEIRNIGSGIAHDLRTPLARLRARLELHRTYPQGSDAEQVIEQGLEDLDRVFTLITALLRISEVDSGTRRSAFRPTEINALCTEIFELYEPLAEGKSLAFAFHRGPDVTLLADHELLLEALANLMENAIKFTPEGGAVTLSVATAPASCTIAVSDTGPGVPDSERTAIRSAFYRYNPDRTIKGHGLGLSLVEAIARLHGFKLSIGANTGGHGAVFALVCPTAPNLPT